MKKRTFRIGLLVMTFASSLVLLSPARAEHLDPCVDAEYPYTPKDYVVIYSIMPSECGEWGSRMGELTVSGWIKRDNEHSFPVSYPAETFGTVTCEEGANCQLILTLSHPEIETGLYEVEVWSEGSLKNEDGDSIWWSKSWSYGGCQSAARYTTCQGNAWLPPPSCEYVDQIILNLCKDWPLLDE